jgi:hypothetical protein
VFGGIGIALIIVIALPVAFLVTGGAVAALMGWVLKDDADRRGAGTVWKDLNT